MTAASPSTSLSSSPSRVTAPATRGGVLLGLASAATFGTSGVFGTALIGAGWSPATVVVLRISLAALVLTVPALVALRGRWSQLRRSLGAVAAYGLSGVAGSQLFYFSALQTLSVGVALLLEYLGTVLVVGWVWLRTRRAPRAPTLAGTVLAVVGLVLVLDLTGAQRLDPVGVTWALGAAVALAVYFVVAARADDPLPPVVTVWAGMVVAAVTLALLGVAGVLRLGTGAATVQFAGARTPWLVPVLGLAVLAAAVPYLLGLAAARRLGATLASFVALLEVVFAVVFAWLLLGQLPGAVQLAGGVLIVAGAGCVRFDELRRARADRRASESTGPVPGTAGSLVG